MNGGQLAALKLRMLRIDAGHSRHSLGKAAGVSHSTIGKLEDEGALPSPRVAHALATQLGKKPTDIWPELAEAPERVA
jgi:DNA-binding XRE family transcriptional regulator